MEVSNNLALPLILVLVGLVVYGLVSCQMKCDKYPPKEKYWSLPFAGGDVRTFASDPHRIEGPIGRVMDETDASSGYPL